MNIKKVKISSSIKIRATQPECILVFNPDRDLFYEFNSSSSELFLSIKDGISYKRIIGNLIDKYEMTEKEACKELKSFIDKILKLGIVLEKEN